MKRLAALCACLLFLCAPPLLANELQTGSVAIYSNGQVKKLVAQKPGWTRWESARKRSYTLSYLPYLPTLEYQRFPPERGGYSRQVNLTDPLELVPFGNETSISFVLNRIKSDGSSSKRHWRCRYQGKGYETMQERRWSVENYRCTRFNPFSRKSFSRQRDLSYSPDLGMIITETLTRRGQPAKETRLEYLLAPEQASAEVIAELVKGLKN